MILLQNMLFVSFYACKYFEGLDIVFSNLSFPQASLVTGLENCLLLIIFFFQINIKIIRGHDDCINSAKFFCDDRKILTCSSDGTVRMWRTADGKELVQYENLHAPGATITKCDISFDNNR